MRAVVGKLAVVEGMVEADKVVVQNGIVVGEDKVEVGMVVV